MLYILGGILFALSFIAHQGQSAYETEADDDFGPDAAKYAIRGAIVGALVLPLFAASVISFAVAIVGSVR